MKQMTPLDNDSFFMYFMADVQKVYNRDIPHFEWKLMSPTITYFKHVCWCYRRGDTPEQTAWDIHCKETAT